MIVHYYEISGCVPDTYNGTPVLIAPLNVPSALLQKRQFSPLPDGRFAHAITEQEYRYIMSCGNAETVVIGAPAASEDQHKGNRLSSISLALMVMRLLTLGSSTFLGEEGSGAAMAVGSAFGLAAWVLVIIVRVKYPQNTFGKVLFTIYLVMYILALIALIVIAVACAVACNSFIDEMQRCPG